MAYDLGDFPGMSPSNPTRFPYTSQDVHPATEVTTTEVTTVTKEKWVDGKLVEKTVDKTEKTEKTTTTGRNHPPTYITYNTKGINQGDLISSVIEGSAKATRR